ncbi:DNA cytosine methyltransferase [Agrobacterium tumefaciens]|uniref:DNA cytosine methyltransferase n=1 Tax=Agrobacterium tumefaciens TaxID=358 RepID=UPI0021CF2271|nr:DNA cytosine methyltransferase [Agrobacterium tumefaciens]
MTAYYNEIDPFAAAWLRELIKAGHITPGDVDTRSIVDVRPDDLRKYTQCHFFAGIGVWSYSLRRAGWPDSRPIWTMSCPCQPFSAAGKGGGFDDERHLWPFAHYLVEECRPAVVAGEQVASKDGLAWLDLVQADLEGTDYAFGAVDTCAAGFGSPNIRQRLYWMAHADGGYADGGYASAEWQQCSGEQRQQQEDRRRRKLAFDRLAVTESIDRGAGLCDFRPARNGRAKHSDCGAIRELAYASVTGLEGRDARPVGRQCTPAQRGGGVEFAHQPGTGPTNGLWRDADWLFCRDGKWRPVEPGTFPLAHGATARVGRLRGYGNAINAEQAQGFIEACIETLNGRFQLTDLSDFAADTNIQDVFG